MSEAGNTPQKYIWEYGGNPTNVSTSIINPPIGALIVDNTTGNIYRKTTGYGDNSGFALVVSGATQRNVLLGVVTATETHASYNSTTYVASAAAKVTLTPGTWWIESRGIVGDSQFGTSTPQCQLGFTGTATYGGGNVIGGQDASNPPSFPAYLGFPAGNSTTIFPMNYTSGNGQDLMRFLKVVVTAAGDLTLNIAQQVATASDLSLYVGSFIQAIPIG